MRGVTEISISGERAAEIVPILLAAASGDGITRRTLVERFTGPDRQMVDKLLDELIKRSIIVRADCAPEIGGVETSLDVFYWHFGQTAQTAIGNMNKKPMVIIGVNTLSRRIAAALQSFGLKHVKVVDFHILRNLRLFDSDGRLLENEWPATAPLDYAAWEERIANEEFSCLVATSDFGGPHLMRDWNRFCIENNVHFLPVVLDRFIGTIGPLVIPGETACYECMRLRENSNMEAPEIERIAEFNAAERQAVVGFHPAMSSVLGEMAAMELCKVYGGGIPWRVSSLIEVNLLAPAIMSRRVLKLPLCPVCSRAIKTSAMTIDKYSFVPGHDPTADELR